MTTPEISVIVPTRARMTRAPLLLRALDSITSQCGVHAIPIVVVNGGEQDETLVDRLRSTSPVLVLDPADAGLPAALHAGLARVDTPFVTSLDDDDVLLPGALAVRHAALTADAGVDVVVTNGFRRLDGRDDLLVPDPERVRRDPLRALFDGNWLLPGSWLARTAAVAPWLYDRMPPYLENTYLALRFASELRMRYLDEPTVVWDHGSPDRLSRSLAYLEGQPASLARLLALPLPLPPAIRGLLRQRLRLAWHALANESLERGDLSLAMRHHLRTVAQRGGWRHLPFLRHVVAAWWHARN